MSETALNAGISKQTEDRLIEQVVAEEQNLKSKISNLKSDSKPKRELPKRSSISALFKEIHKEEVVVEDLNKVELSPDNLQHIWEEFLKENRDKLQNAFLSAAQNQTPVLVEDRVTFTASNNVSLEMLQLHKMDITTYFRKRTTSATVVPDFILHRDDSQVKSYKTTKDRLKDMIDSNAAVLKMIEKFDLNIE